MRSGLSRVVTIMMSWPMWRLSKWLGISQERHNCLGLSSGATPGAVRPSAAGPGQRLAKGAGASTCGGLDQRHHGISQLITLTKRRLGEMRSS